MLINIKKWQTRLMNPREAEAYADQYEEMVDQTDES